MPTTGSIIVLGSLLLAAFLFCFNDRFRTELGRSARRWKMLVFGPAIIYLFVAAFAGFESTNEMIPGAIGAALQIFLMMFAMVIQWVAMMWIMARPRIDWYMPGEGMDNLTWDDYVGNDEIRDKVKDLMDFIENPKKFRAKGARLPKGILMQGPPGVGKTYLARIIANMAGIPIAICESSSMQSPFVAVGALMVKALYRKLNKYARQYGAALVFFDEIDAIGMSRSGPGGNQANGGGFSFFGGGSGGILNALLGCMDGINSTEPFVRRTLRRFGLVKSKLEPVTVITVGATNAPLSALDPALIREGRFDWKITATASGDKGREEQIRYFLSKRQVDETVEVPRLVSDFRGDTPVTIDSVINDAMIRAIRDGRDTIGYADIMTSLWDRNFGLRSPITLGDLDIVRVAEHEAGHALMAVLWPMTGWSCWGAGIVPRSGALGMVVSKPYTEIHTATQEDLSRNILLSVGSRAVEELRMGIKMNGFSGDLSQATNTALGMLAHYGMGEALLSFGTINQATNPALLRDAELIVRAHLELAKELVKENDAAVKAVAAALADRKELDGREVQTIVLAHVVTKDWKEQKIWARASKIIKRLKDEARAKRLRTRLSDQITERVAMAAVRAIENGTSRDEETKAAIVAAGAGFGGGLPGESAIDALVEPELRGAPAGALDVAALIKAAEAAVGLLNAEDDGVFDGLGEGADGAVSGEETGGAAAGKPNGH